jgi:excisionase family DNA binding protein
MAQVQAASPWLTIEQLAERWQKPLQTLYKLRQRGKTPPAVKLGRTLRFHIDDVTAYEERQRAEATA